MILHLIRTGNYSVLCIRHAKSGILGDALVSGLYALCHLASEADEFGLPQARTGPNFSGRNITDNLPGDKGQFKDKGSPYWLEMEW